MVPYLGSHMSNEYVKKKGLENVHSLWWVVGCPFGADDRRRNAGW